MDKTSNLIVRFVSFFFILSLFASCNDKKSKEDCDDDLIWDFSPVIFELLPTDSNGKCLFGTELTEENKTFIENTTVTYKDSVYHCVLNGKETRAYMAMFEGLTLSQLNYWDEENEVAICYGYCLEFGEFDGEDDYENMKLTVTWPDGSKDEVDFSRTLRWDKCDPVITNNLIINGKKVDMEYSVATIERKF